MDRSASRTERPGSFLGRSAELQALLQLFEPGSPDVLAITGVPGIGKTRLLREFMELASASDRRVICIDCRNVEPTAACFEAALEEASALAPIREGVCQERASVLCLDHFEHFLLLDAYLRRRACSTSTPGWKMVLSSRIALGVGWSALDCTVREVRLGALNGADSQSLLADLGVEPEVGERVLEVTGGHPLALRLAAMMPRRELGLPRHLELPELVNRLTTFFLESVEQARLREALEATACVRRMTRPLLRQLVEADGDDELYGALANSPLVEARADGLSLHHSVHEIVASSLRASDPGRFVEYRRRAWRALELESSKLAQADLWRYTADVIYLIDDPVVREAFFPSGPRPYAVEPMLPEDLPAVLEIAEHHDGAQERERLRVWSVAHPSSFHVVRDHRREVCGFYVLLDSSRVTDDEVHADPTTRAVLSQSSNSQAEGDEPWLFIRRWLSNEDGDAPSAIQGACWLDIKRAYLAGRPRLRRVFLCASDLAPYEMAAAKLGFEALEPLAGSSFSGAVLELGKGSVEAWLGRLVRGSLGIEEDISLDVECRELLLGSETLCLTPRELEVVRILMESDGRPVGRDELLREAWGGGHAVGSNVVDVLIRGLRKKLGTRSGLLKTIRGVGYRWGS